MSTQISVVMTDRKKKVNVNQLLKADIQIEEQVRWFVEGMKNAPSFFTMVAAYTHKLPSTCAETPCSVCKSIQYDTIVHIINPVLTVPHVHLCTTCMSR
jgi:hypothetical protein